VKLWRLDEVPEPVRRPEVRVVEVFSGRREEVEPVRTPQRDSEKTIENRSAEERIRGNLKGVLVEGGQYMIASTSIVVAKYFMASSLVLSRRRGTGGMSRSLLNVGERRLG